MSEHERQEWSGLWEAVFGEPPPIAADAALTARVLVKHLPPIAPYEPGVPKRPRS